MKTSLLFFLFGFSIAVINAQCTESLGEFGNNIADPPSYNISGDINISLIAKNEVKLDFSANFSVASGPDLRAFLVSSEGKTNSELRETIIANLNHIDFGLIQPNGQQSFTATIPNDKNISDFDTVFIYCLLHNHFWDLGKFSSFNATNCSVLNVDNFKIDAISIYPNPAKNKIQISNIVGISNEIRIFNILGKQVFSQQKNLDKTIDVLSLQSGIYIVKILSKGKTKTQKLVIQ